MILKKNIPKKNEFYKNDKIIQYENIKDQIVKSTN